MKKPYSALKIFLIIIAAFISAVSTVIQSSASTTIFTMDFEYSGGSEPAGPMPWATARFVDTSPNAVTLTMSAGNLTATEFISAWLFNFDPLLDSTLLSFSPVGTPGSMPNGINTGSNSFKAGGSKFYDIEFDFPPPKGHFANKFTTGETVIYDITYNGSGTINASSFLFTSESHKSNAPYYSAAHIQSIGTGGDSGWIASTTVAPEPGSAILFVAGGVTLGVMGHCRRRNKHS
jgi:hypothetical protein